MKNILFISSIYRCTERVVPVIRQLSKRHSVDVIALGEMSPHSKWAGNIDLRQSFYSICNQECSLIKGPPREQVVNSFKDGAKLLPSVKIDKYDMVILDDNLCKKSWGFQAIYSFIKSRKKIPVVACPHGNRELNERFVLKNTGTCFDYSFIFGQKEKSIFKSNNLIPGGIPSNDSLSDYQKTGKHILVIVGFVNGIKLQPGYHNFSEKTFSNAGILDLQQKYGCPIIVKEKSTFVKGEISLRSLERYSGVRVVMDVSNDSKLIADSLITVGAPSTLSFKSIQLGIPTVILRGYGMLGNLADYVGCVKCKKSEVMKSVEHQFSAGKQEAWIKNTLEGGVDFTSTSKYLEFIESKI